MNPLKTIDKLLNAVTMYRLLVYGLSVLLLGALVLSLVGTLPISASAIALSAVVILSVGYVVDRLFTIVLSTYTNNDSSLITCLILCCILPPSTSLHHLALIALGTLIAVASKFVIALHRKHIFNPAAFGAAVLGVSTLLPAIWWIGSPCLLPLTLIFGILVLRKVRRFQLFSSFLFASLVVTILLGIDHHLTLGYTLKTAFESSPLIFLGSVMLTEPSTMPPVRWKQLFYGLIVGAIFTSQLSAGSVSATPEIALLIGNLYAYLVSPKYKLRLRLKRVQQLSPLLYDFGFVGSQGLHFQPGQYLEWTMPRSTADSRGNRRTFSIASAPGDEEVHIAIKIPNAQSKTSAFKKALTQLKPGEVLFAGQVAGDFVLPKDTAQKLTFIAGGIGITPFLSMVKDMINTNQKRDIVLFYLVADKAEYCYKEVWQKAAALGVRVIPVLTTAESDTSWGEGIAGRLNAEQISQRTTDYLDRRYYISGPPGLVDAYVALLTKLNVKRRSIVTDHFSGY
jgi:ferredoxin-NADP reductase/Na+-transporting NADH:ubiquinone oxidoreductase subunit NqrB